MKRLLSGEVLLGLVALALAGLAPNLFPAAQAGLAKLSTLGKYVLIPSIIGLVLVYTVARMRHYTTLTNRLAAGAGAGLIATLGLEVVRATSFRLGGMPGDMPRLLGVLLTDRFMVGPSALSDVLGWSYHFWNGLAFGLIFAVIFGHRPRHWSLIFGQLIGLGFLLSPAVSSLGIGFMGLELPAMPVTVIVAHLVFGLILAHLTQRWVHK